MNDIKYAIEHRLEIEFFYDGKFRRVQPAAYGLNLSGDNELLRAYQVDGESASRNVPSWASFSVNKITDLSVSQHGFSLDPPLYKKGDKGMSKIYAEL